MSFSNLDHGRLTQFYQGSSRASSVYGRISDRRDCWLDNSPAASQFHDAASYRRAFTESITRNSPQVSRVRVPSVIFANVHQDINDLKEGYRRFEQFWGQETAKLMFSTKPPGELIARPKKKRLNWRQRIRRKAKAFFYRLSRRGMYPY